MSFGADSSGAVLEYVTRDVNGVVFTTKSRWDKAKGEIVTSEVPVEDPVIVFFPTGTAQVLPLKVAEAKGFLEVPNILNFQEVVDQQSIAGKFKFALTPAARNEAWLRLENLVISGCISQRGHPLPEGVTYSQKSAFVETEEPKEKKA